MTCFFVGGSQRSGTTLLQTILCQDQAVNPLVQEAKYLRHLLAAYRFGARTFDAETKDYFRDRAAYVRFHRSVLSLFLEQVRALYPRAQHLCLREPHLTMFFPELDVLVPDARYVCIVRDPRDVVASMIRVGGKLAAQGTGGDPMARLFASRDIEAICAHYQSFYAPVFASQRPEFQRRCAILRYEDLVQQPAQALDRLREFTGLALAGVDPGRDPDTGQVNYDAVTDYQKAWKTALDGRAIEVSRVGAHADTLTADEIARVGVACQGMMQRFGYAAAG